MDAVLEWLSRWGVIPALALMGLAMCWHLTEMLRYRRKIARVARRAAQPPVETAPQPLISDDRMEGLRPGDTVLLLLSLDDMTADQQTYFVDAVKEMIVRAQARGIEFIVVPDWKHKTIVVARNDLPKPPEDEATKKANAEWLAQVWVKESKRDQARLAALHEHAEKISQESAAAILQEARLRWGKALEPLIQRLLRKTQALQDRQYVPEDAQALLEDVRALSEAVNKTP